MDAVQQAALNLFKQDRLDLGKVEIIGLHLAAEDINCLNAGIMGYFALLLFIALLLLALCLLSPLMVIVTAAGNLKRTGLGDLELIDGLAQIREIGQRINAGQRFTDLQGDQAALLVKISQCATEFAAIHLANHFGG